MRASLWSWASNRTSNPVVAAIAARDALLYAVLWETGLRAGDALRLMAQAVTPISDDCGRGGLQLKVVRAKRVLCDNDQYTMVVWDSGTKFALPKVYKIYMTALDALAILPLERHGPLFRGISVTDEGVGVLGSGCAWAEIDRHYKDTLTGLKFPAEVRRHVTLHSFHGSRAARERAQGIPPEETCRSMHWSRDMYDYYTEGRIPMSVDNVFIMTTAETVTPLI